MPDPSVLQGTQSVERQASTASLAWGGEVGGTGVQCGCREFDGGCDIIWNFHVWSFQEMSMDLPCEWAGKMSEIDTSGQGVL